MRAISIQHLMAPELSPVQLARLAGELGCQHLCLFTQEPAPDFFVPTVRPADLPELRACMAGEGLTAYAVTSFALTPTRDVAGFAEALDLGAALGAIYANVRVADPDESRAADSFGQLCAMDRDRGITAGIEFMALDGSDALERTLRIVAATAAGKISLDPLHIVRSGVTPERLRMIDPALFGYLQICDGPATASPEEYMREAGADRLLPGEGVFPLGEIMALVPRDRPVGMEIPRESERAAGVSATERVGAALAATRRVLATIDGA